MSLSSVGIVLKSLSTTGNKVALLDKQHGRIECIGRVGNKSAGTMLSYILYQKHNNLFLQDITPLYTPMALGAHDVLFLHHIIELIYYFAPVGSCVDGVFDLLAFLYSLEHMLISVRFKKLFLFKLLVQLGATPDNQAVQRFNMGSFHDMRIALFTEDLITSHDEKRLDMWLWSCVIQHPYIEKFKTVHFLEKNRVL